MDKGYVSEFAAFMNHYLEEHPEVVEEQFRNWDAEWNPKLDPEAVDDVVHDDGYGFAWWAWRTGSDKPH